jgi:hypothetical protein
MWWCRKEDKFKANIDHKSCLKRKKKGEGRDCSSSGRAFA